MGFSDARSFGDGVASYNHADVSLTAKCPQTGLDRPARVWHKDGFLFPGVA